MEQYQGPLPSPEVLLKYREVMPDLPERLVAQFEAQTVHRHQIERAAVAGNLEAQVRGQRYGLAVGVVGLLVAGWVAVYGNAVAGVVIGLGDVVALAGVFVYGRQAERVERNSKSAANP